MNLFFYIIFKEYFLYLWKFNNLQKSVLNIQQVTKSMSQICVQVEINLKFENEIKILNK